MISTLRKKLALLLISVIATVVLCTTAAALIVSEHQLNLGERVRFNAQVDQVVQEVRMAGIMQSTQLAKVEVAYDLIIAISDDGGLVPFRGGWQPLTDRSTLVTRVMASASDVAERWDGTVRGDHNERYLAAVCRIGGYRSVRTVIMLEDMQKEDAQRHSQRLMYAGIALLALIVLSLFCWLFTNRAMRPIQDAYDKQNQFVAAASHELRTPLQVIRTATDALKLNPIDNASFTAQIVDELSHMSKLTEDLLILAAAPNWKTVKGDPIEADLFIRNALNHHRAAAAQKEVALTLQASSAPLPLLEGNEIMLQRALNVLIDNAVCYTPPGGHVMVAVALKPRTIEISVQDDGPGIASEHRAHIFERFYRIDKSRTDRAHSGLGLSIAKQIIVNHGGQLTYIPIKPHGSRFCMILPLISNDKVSNGN